MSHSKKLSEVKITGTVNLGEMLRNIGKPERERREKLAKGNNPKKKKGR